MNHHYHPGQHLDPYPHLDPYSFDHLDPYPDPDPYPDRTARPATDAPCRALIDQTVESLIILRGGSTSDPGAQLSVLASLAADTTDRIPDTVWSARVHHRYSWNQIAERLAITADTARKRYSHYLQLRSEQAVHGHCCQNINTEDCRHMCR